MNDEYRILNGNEEYENTASQFLIQHSHSSFNILHSPFSRALYDIALTFTLHDSAFAALPPKTAKLALQAKEVLHFRHRYGSIESLC